MSEVRETVVLHLQIDNDDLTQKIAKNTTVVKGLKTEIKDLEKVANEALAKGMGASAAETQVKIEELNNKVRALNGETKSYKNTIDESTKATNAQMGSYEQLYREWKLAEVQLKTLEGTIKRNADGTFQLTEKYKQQSAVVRQAKEGLLLFNKGVLDGRLNVGNYANSIAGLEEKLGDLEEIFKHMDKSAPEFEKTRESIEKTKLEIDQLKGKVDEFGDKEPKNPMKKAFEDTREAAGGLTEAFTLLTLLRGEDEKKSAAEAAVIKGVAIATAALNVIKGAKAALDTLELVRGQLMVEVQVEQVAATVALTSAKEAEAGATEIATVAQEGLNVAMEANPVGILIIGLLALGAALAGLNAYMTRSSDETDRLEEETEKLNKAYEESHRLAENRIKVAEAELNVLIAQGASIEEVKAAQDKINAAKEKDIRLNIAAIESAIALDKSKIRDVIANNSLYESYLTLAAGVYQWLGLEEKAKETMNLVAKNKSERAKEAIDDLKKQEGALADAQAALLNLQADEIKSDAETKKKLQEQAKKHNDEMLKLQQELIDSQNRILDDARIREITILQTDFSRRIAAIKGNGKLQIALRAQLVIEERELEAKINEKYDQLDADRALKARETEIALELQLLIDAGAERLAKQNELLDVQMAEELAKKDLSEAEKKNIEEKYRQLRLKAEADNNKAIADQLHRDTAARLQAQITQAQIAHDSTIELQKQAAAEQRDFLLQNDKLTSGERLKIEADYQKTISDLTAKAQADRLKQVQDGVSMTQQLIQVGENYFKETLKRETDAQVSALDARLQAGQISQGVYNAERKALLTKQAKEEKAIALFDGTIAGIVAVIKALPNIPLSVLAGVTAATQLALIASKPIPAFAQGGGVSGTRINASHGVPSNINPGDNVLITAKTGEVILNEEQQARLGGDATFAAIGVPGFYGGGVADTLGAMRGNYNHGIPHFDGGGLVLSSYTTPIGNEASRDRQLSLIQELAERPSVVYVGDINTVQNAEAVRVERANIG